MYYTTSRVVAEDGRYTAVVRRQYAPALQSTTINDDCRRTAPDFAITVSNNPTPAVSSTALFVDSTAVK